MVNVATKVKAFIVDRTGVFLSSQEENLCDIWIVNMSVVLYGYRFVQVYTITYEHMAYAETWYQPFCSSR